MTEKLFTGTLNHNQNKNKTKTKYDIKHLLFCISDDLATEVNPMDDLDDVKGKNYTVFKP